MKTCIPFRLEFLLCVDDHEEFVGRFGAVPGVEEVFERNGTLLRADHVHLALLGSPAKHVQQEAEKNTLAIIPGQFGEQTRSVQRSYSTSLVTIEST